jgi:chemotaxis protein CheD
MIGHLDIGRTQRVVGISEMLVSGSPEDVLVTYSLGSCLALSLFDPEAGLGGLVHCMLPLSRMDAARAVAQPEMFVDTGIAALLQAMFDAGASRRSVIAKAAGAAAQMDAEGLFRIGERNHVVMRKVLWKNGILLAAEDVGGTDSRTVLLDVATGRTSVRKNGVVIEL